MDASEVDSTSGEISTSLPGHTTLKPRTDSGWAWIVMIGAFLVNFATIGFLQSLGVYLTVWMEDFETSAATAGLVISAGSVMRGLLSTFSGALCTSFGSRSMIITGGVLTAGGILICAFAPSIEYLIISNGLVIALGANLAFVSAFKALGSHFKKRFAVAAGLASAGVSVGQLALPPLYTVLIEKYGWRGSMLITAAISMHVVASGMLMRPNNSRKQLAKTEQSRVIDNTEGTSVIQATDKHRNNTADDQEFSKLDGRECTADNVIEQDINKMHRILGGSMDNDNDSDVGTLDDNGMATVATCRGDHLVEPIDSSTKSIKTDPIATAVIVDGSEKLDLDESVRKPNSTLGYIVHYIFQFKHFMLDTYGLRRLAHNSRYIIMFFATFFLGTGTLCTAYIVPRATLAGLDAEAASLLLSLIGAGSILGRISNGWFIDKNYITAELLFALALLASSVFVSLIPASYTFIPMAVLSSLFGIALGICSILFLVTARSLVKPIDAISAAAVQLFAFCLGNATGVFVAGVIYDVTQKYDFAFFTAGGLLLIASVLAFVVYFYQKCKRSCCLPTSKTDTELLGELAAEKQLQLAGSVFCQAVTELNAGGCDAVGAKV